MSVGADWSSSPTGDLKSLRSVSAPGQYSS